MKKKILLLLLLVSTLGVTLVYAAGGQWAVISQGLQGPGGQEEVMSHGLLPTSTPTPTPTPTPVPGYPAYAYKASLGGNGLKAIPLIRMFDNGSIIATTITATTFVGTGGLVGVTGTHAIADITTITITNGLVTNIE